MYFDSPIIYVLSARPICKLIKNDTAVSAGRSYSLQLRLSEDHTSISSIHTPGFKTKKMFIGHCSTSFFQAFVSFSAVFKVFRLHIHAHDKNFAEF